MLFGNFAGEESHEIKMELSGKDKWRGAGGEDGI